jgi:hypothetical protein
VFKFGPYIDKLPHKDEPYYLVQWHGEDYSPFRAWIRDDIIYMLEMNIDSHSIFPKNHKKSYPAYKKNSKGQWEYYFRRSTRDYSRQLDFVNNQTMVESMNKIFAEHQLQLAIDSALNSNRK